MTLDEKNAVADLMTSALLERLPDEVELVFRYGSHVHGGTHRHSDVDFSYVPRDPHRWDSITVMVDDVLFDLYAMHWDALEQMAEHDSWSRTIMVDLEVTWAANDEARDRMSALVARHHELERPEAWSEMVGKALAAFERTGSDYYQLSRTVQIGETAAARVHANRILQTLFHTLTLLNQSRADTRKLDQLLALERRPERLGDLVNAVLRAPDGPALLAACDALLGEYEHGPLADESSELIRLAVDGRFDEVAKAASRLDERVRRYSGEIGASLYCFESAEELRVALAEGRA